MIDETCDQVLESIRGITRRLASQEVGVTPVVVYWPPSGGALVRRIRVTNTGPKFADITLTGPKEFMRAGHEGRTISIAPGFFEEWCNFTTLVIERKADRVICGVSLGVSISHELKSERRERSVQEALRVVKGYRVFRRRSVWHTIARRLRANAELGPGVKCLSCFDTGQVTAGDSEGIYSSSCQECPAGERLRVVQALGGTRYAADGTERHFP
jgi:hypothetical protein